MGVSNSYLSKAEVQRLLGVNAFGMWRLVRKYDDFPTPTEHPNLGGPFRGREPEEVWDGGQVSAWAAGTAEFTHRGAVLMRPLPEEFATGRWAGYKDTVRGPALDWRTALGVVRIVHCADRKAAADVATDITAKGNPDSVVTVCALYGDMGIRGPSLVAADTAHPGIEYEADWSDVAALAGQDLPWWPGTLRQAPLIRQWQPGSPAAVVEVPASTSEKTLRRAAGNDTFDVTARAAATDMANSIRNDRIDHTAHDIEIFCKDGYGENPNPVVAGAVPDTTRHPLPCDGDRQALKAGWHKLALSSHPDAVAALEIVIGREPELLPFGSVTEIPVQSGTISARWTSRLTMCDPTAAHAVLAQDDRAEAFFLDPLTDMPVLRTPREDGKQLWRFYAPLSPGRRRGTRFGRPAPHRVDHHQRRPRPPCALYTDRASVVGRRLG
ncbi:hypothetical protein [Streptomyces sp. NBC_00212]|uniref:hypothetical protein n=1 Tax=Streptomyces sp. NBC_00212 TaxID=2975684 RepID=UPI002F918C58